jgi:lipooligosaccharide transport system ATP-binding protein
MTEPILFVQLPVKRYGDATVVRDMAFEIAPGDCLGAVRTAGLVKAGSVMELQ